MDDFIEYISIITIPKNIKKVEEDMIPNFNHLETNKYLDDKM